MFKAMSARALTTLTSAVFGIFTARLILGHAGVEFFALYALVAALPSLIQFQDLGTGAALVNVIATSGDPAADPEVSVTLSSVGRVMLISAGVTMLANSALMLTGGWEWLLGEAGQLPNAALAAFTCLAIWAIAIPLGIWQRVLLGLRRNHVTILIQGLMAPLNFALVWLLLQAGPQARSFLSLASYLAAFGIAVIGMTAALRFLPQPITQGYSRLLARSKYPGVPVMDVGWPMLAQLISAPLSLTAQRYVLAQSATTAEVAEYLAAAQVYLALLGVITAAGVALWPSFTRRRAAGTLANGPFRLSGQMALGCAGVLAMIWLLRVPLFEFTTSGQVLVRDATALAFSLMVVLQAALYPLGMFIMDKPGIRFQVVPTVTMAVGSLVLAMVVTPSLGVIGPVLSNAVCVLLAQLVPFSLYIHRNRARLWQAG